MTEQVKAALLHVRKYFPEVTTVVFTNYGWQYFTDFFEKPVFDHRIDQSLLEEAYDSVHRLPDIFVISKQNT